MSTKIDGARIMVIGGAGLVGSHLVDQLIREEVREILVFDNFARGHYENLAVALQDSRVRLIEADIRDRNRLRSALRGVDHVFLLAALWLLECLEQPRLGLDTNVMGTYNVLEACRDEGVKKLVFSSSASVYGDAEFAPMTEAHPFKNQTFYGATKIAGEQFLRAFWHMYKLNYVALRYFNIYGPRQDYRGAYTNVIMKALDRLDQGLPPVIYGDGSQAYDFISVKDVARANILALKSNASNEALNICTGARTTINELVRILIELSGADIEPEHRPADQVFVTDRLGDPAAARQKIGFTFKIPLRQGLQELIAWRRVHMAAHAEHAHSTEGAYA